MSLKTDWEKRIEDVNEKMRKRRIGFILKRIKDKSLKTKGFGLWIHDLRAEFSYIILNICESFNGDCRFAARGH